MFFTINYSCFNITFLMGNFNIIFLVVLLSIFFMIVFYGYFYMSSELMYMYYYAMLLIFLLSMILFSISYSSYVLLMGWDLLGASSFFLIMYYGSWSSILGAFSTSLTMRFGDLFLLVFLNFYFNFDSFLIMYFVGFLLALASFTKGAQYPFMGWLTRAMSAPTPVSALVHSSTLVVSGSFLIFFFSFLNLGPIFMFISLFSLFISGCLSLLEEDYKKLVALSTLSQVSFCMLILFGGFMIGSYLHVLSHAYVKSVLFMVLGVSIYLAFGQQDSRLLSSRFSNIFLILILELTLFSLCGLMFLGMTLSKESILSFFYFNIYSFSFYIIFLGGVFFTFLYVTRLWVGSYTIVGNGLKIIMTDINFTVMFLGLMKVIYFVIFLYLNFFYLVPFLGGTELLTGLFYYFFFLLFYKFGFFNMFICSVGMLCSYLFDLLNTLCLIVFNLEYLFFKFLQDFFQLFFFTRSYLIYLNILFFPIVLMLTCLMFFLV